MSQDFWRGKRVFLTGHTGFKGGWLTLWLRSLGAEVYGYALSPPTDPNFFDVAQLHSSLTSHVLADIRELESLRVSMSEANPQIVFHLAAQPLVRSGYEAPVETFSVNTLGTVNVLEAVRHQPGIRSVVVVTSDKCYENREWSWGYRENERLGGFDPYSNSKACAELVTDAYRRSFLSKGGISVASARAGNVIGGGDWAVGRLVPDFLRALDSGQPLRLRAPQAVRPWQHVMEPLYGYLILAERLFLEGQNVAEAWNFGPADDDVRTVSWVASKLAARLSTSLIQTDVESLLHEAQHLKLDSSKARERLGWRPRWRLERALESVIEWHRAWRSGADMREYTLKQIRDYEQTDEGAALDGSF